MVVVVDELELHRTLELELVLVDEEDDVSDCVEEVVLDSTSSGFAVVLSFDRTKMKRLGGGYDGCLVVVEVIWRTWSFVMVAVGGRWRAWSLALVSESGRLAYVYAISAIATAINIIWAKIKGHCSDGGL